MSSKAIAHDQEKHCFYSAFEEGRSEPAVLEYRLLADNGIDFNRTYVPASLRGQGLAEALVRKGLAWARERGYQIQASCWYVQKFLP